MQFFTKSFDGDGGFQNHVRTTEIHGPLFLGDVTRHVQQQFAFVFTFRVVFGNGGLWGGLELPSGGQLVNEFFAGEKWWECMDEDLARGNGDHGGRVGVGLWGCGGCAGQEVLLGCGALFLVSIQKPDRNRKGEI